MNQEEFFLANQVDGQLTDAQMMQMLHLPEGDSAQAQSSVPAADIAQPTEVVEEEKKVEPAPVVLAKDGVHTIPYEKLEEARQAEKHWKQVAADAQAQLDVAAKAAKPAEVPSIEAKPPEEADVFGDYSEEAIKRGVAKLVASQVGTIRADMEAKLAAVLDPLKKTQAEAATDSHFSAIYKAHPDVESVVPSQAMQDWIAKQPSFARSGYQAVIEQGSAEQVIELLDTYKAATGKTAAPAGKPDVAAAAAAAIANARSSVPSSLSEIPASSAHTDPIEAMLAMSDAGLMNLFDGKTPEQINALMNKTI